jgi:Leucine-rich repeat (LRR) protein
MQEYNDFLDNVSVSELTHSKTIERINRRLSSASDPQPVSTKMRMGTLYAGAFGFCAVIGVLSFMTVQGFFVIDPVEESPPTVSPLSTDCPYEPPVSESPDSYESIDNPPELPFSQPPVNPPNYIQGGAVTNAPGVPGFPGGVVITGDYVLSIDPDYTDSSIPCPPKLSETAGSTWLAGEPHPPEELAGIPLPPEEIGNFPVEIEPLPVDSAPVVICLTDSEITDERLAEMVANGEIPQDVSVLRLGFNQITDLSPLASLSELTRLRLNDNEITEISPLPELVNLRFLDLSNNEIRSVSSLTGLVELRELRLSNNDIYRAGSLTELPNLDTLRLNANPVRDSHRERILEFADGKFADAFNCCFDGECRCTEIADEYIGIDTEE